MTLTAASSEAPSLLLQQAKSVAIILESELGAAVTLYDAQSGLRIPVAKAGGLGQDLLAPSQVQEFAAQRRPRVQHQDAQTYLAVIPLEESGAPRLVAAGLIDKFARSEGEERKEIPRIQKLCQLLAQRLTEKACGGISVSSQANRDGTAWNVLAAFDALLRKGHLWGDCARFQGRALRGLLGVLNAETAAWIPGEVSTPVVVQGEHALSAWDCRQLATRLAARNEWDKAGVLILNAVEAAALSGKLPEKVWVLALRVNDEQMPGLLIVFNKRHPGRSPAGNSLPRAAGENYVEFKRQDAALLAPFLTLLSLQWNTHQHFRELKDFLVGLTRALTSAIDAKDPYTFGHSERVARIAVALGKQLGLSEESTGDIYLAGLLHDLGKIGIRDNVLLKAAALTPEEYDHLKEHPVIGHRILADLKAIRHLLPGVLYHHERIDGNGYPEGLAGDEIPQLARIIAVADSYDAMSTDRPYRRALPADQIEAAIQAGAGTQWDPDVVCAFLKCQAQVRSIRQRGVGESLRQALEGAFRDELPLSEAVMLANLTSGMS